MTYNEHAIMPVEIRHIHAFHAVAEALNFRRASERLGVAQPALSRTIKDLEEALRVPLFERTTRVTRLTESGRIFLKQTSKIIAELDHAVSLAQRANSGAAGELNVGFNDHAIAGLLPQIIRRFRAKFIDVEVNLLDSTNPRSLESVLDGEFDIAFMGAPQHQPELEQMVIRHERIVCILPTAHPLTRKRQISITDLAEEPFVMGRWESWKTYNRVIRDFCAEHGFVPKVIQEAEHSDGIMGLIAAAMGVSLQVESAWIRTLKGIAVRPLREPPPEIRTSAVWRRDRRRRSHALNHFIEAISEVVAEGSTSPG